MAILSKLLTLPLELRHHIYSYMLLNGKVVHILSVNKTCRQISGLFLACRQLYLEASDYYYDFNTFRFFLREITCSSDMSALDEILTQSTRLGKIRNLQVEAIPGHRFSVKASSDWEENRRFDEQDVRWTHFTRQLTKACETQAAIRLKNLIVVDRLSYHILGPQCLDEKHVQPPELPPRIKDQMMELTRLMEPLKDMIGNITFEISPLGYVWPPIKDGLHRRMVSIPVLQTCKHGLHHGLTR